VGSALPTEPILGEELGVSRTTVREAVKALAAKGMITTGPKVGSRVLESRHWNLFDRDVMAWRTRLPPQPQLVRDLIELRLMMEPAAAALAAERATAEDLVELRGALDAMTAATEGVGDYNEADLRFHRAILDCAHNQFLAQMSDPIAAVLRESFRLSVENMDAARSSLPLHRHVLDAIAAGNARRARKALHDLIARARDDIERALTKKPARTRRRGSAQ
jgi:DNA-binding FadR family transcriptional regulator